MHTSAAEQAYVWSLPRPGRTSLGRASRWSSTCSLYVVGRTVWPNKQPVHRCRQIHQQDMRAFARTGAAACGLENVDVRDGDATALPLEPDSVDVVISNGVLNPVHQDASCVRVPFQPRPPLQPVDGILTRPGGRQPHEPIEGVQVHDPEVQSLGCRPTTSATGTAPTPARK